MQEDLGGWHREKMARLADEEAYKRDVLQSELAAEATRSEVGSRSLAMHDFDIDFRSDSVGG